MIQGRKTTILWGKVYATHTVRKKTDFTVKNSEKEKSYYNKKSTEKKTSSNNNRAKGEELVETLPVAFAS